MSGRHGCTSVFAPYIEDFIEFKRSLGYKFHGASYFIMFDRFAAQNEVKTPEITKELCDEWAMKRPNESDVTKYKRIRVARNLAQFLNAQGLPSYVPRLPGNCRSTFIPHIYTNDEVSRFFAECDKLIVSPQTYSAPLFPAFFRLLYCTGMRVGEAISLLRKDVNLDDGIITIRNPKNGEDRLLPMSESLRTLLVDFSSGYFDGTPDDHFFRKRNGKPLDHSNVYTTFRTLLQNSGISYRGRDKGPRVHDFRHTFSVHSLIKMADDGLDLYYSLPLLSQYLGHKSLEATDRYVRLAEEAFPSILEKMNAVCACVFPEVAKI